MPLRRLLSLFRRHHRYARARARGAYGAEQLLATNGKIPARSRATGCLASWRIQRAEKPQRRKPTAPKALQLHTAGL
jgi:hypothetical protein